MCEFSVGSHRLWQKVVIVELISCPLSSHAMKSLSLSRCQTSKVTAARSSASITTLKPSTVHNSTVEFQEFMLGYY